MVVQDECEVQFVGHSVMYENDLPPLPSPKLGEGVGVWMRGSLPRQPPDQRAPRNHRVEKIGLNDIAADHAVAPDLHARLDASLLADQCNACRQIAYGVGAVVCTIADLRVLANDGFLVDDTAVDDGSGSDVGVGQPDRVAHAPPA